MFAWDTTYRCLEWEVGITKGALSCRWVGVATDGEMPNGSNLVFSHFFWPRHPVILIEILHQSDRRTVLFLIRFFIIKMERYSGWILFKLLCRSQLYCITSNLDILNKQKFAWFDWFHSYSRDRVNLWSFVLFFVAIPIGLSLSQREFVSCTRTDQYRFLYSANSMNHDKV